MQKKCFLIFYISLTVASILFTNFGDTANDASTGTETATPASGGASSSAAKCGSNASAGGICPPGKYLKRCTAEGTARWPKSEGYMCLSPGKDVFSSSSQNADQAAKHGESKEAAPADCAKEGTCGGSSSDSTPSNNSSSANNSGGSSGAVSCVDNCILGCATTTVSSRTSTRVSCQGRVEYSERACNACVVDKDKEQLTRECVQSLNEKYPRINRSQSKFAVNNLCILTHMWN